MLDMANSAPDNIETLGQRIRYARKAARMTQDDVAMHFKINRVSVTQWEADTTKPDIDKVPQLADLLHTETSWLLDAKGYPPLVAPSRKVEKSRIIPGNDLVGAKDLPIYAGTMGGEGYLIVNFDPIDYMKRPAVLENVRGGYGIMVKGDSMVPAYWPDDIALVNPHLSPARDTDAIFFHTPPKEHGDEEAIIKRLVGINDRDWTLAQYNPSKTFAESRYDWPICHRVVGKYNAR